MHQKILRAPDLRAKVGLSRATIDRMVKAGEFPKPVLLTPGTRAVGWIEADVDAWIFSRQLDRS